MEVGEVVGVAVVEVVAGALEEKLVEPSEIA